jgi:hypothetical protein
MGDTMFVLSLNDMRSPKFEQRQYVARATTMKELEAFLERERVDVYQDVVDEPDGVKTYSKSFRRGGLLEWFNPPADYHGVKGNRHFIDLTENVAQVKKMVEEGQLYINHLMGLPNAEVM